MQPHTPTDRCERLVRFGDICTMILSVVFHDIYRRFSRVEAPASYWSRPVVPAVDYATSNINCSPLPPFVRRIAVPLKLRLGLLLSY